MNETESENQDFFTELGILIYESSNSYIATVVVDRNAPFISVADNGGSYSLMVYHKEAIAGDYKISVSCTENDETLGEITSSIDIKVTIESNKIESVTIDQIEQNTEESS